MFFGTISAEDPSQATGLRPFEATARQATASIHRLVKGVLQFNPAEAAHGIKDLVFDIPRTLGTHTPWFAAYFGIMFVLAMAVGGGALSRMSACDFAGGERLRAGDGLVFALSNASRLVMAIVLPILVVAALAVFLMLVGWFLFLPWINVIGGLLYVVMLVLGLVIAFIAIGYVAGFALIVPAVACENCDSGDALQRAYAYTYSRPLHLIGYGLVAIIGFALGYALVNLIAVAALNGTATLATLWTGEEVAGVAGGFQLLDFPPELRVSDGAAGHERFAAAAIGFWQKLVIGLVAAYVFAYFSAASTIAYLLLRRVCDGQEMTEVWQRGMIPGTSVPVPAAAA